MGLTSLQVCMDSDWLHEAESSGGGSISMLDSSTTNSPSAADILAACTTRPQLAAAALMDGGRRLRPPHDHPQKCPRCESTHTKFCYYNNYSLSQPRYFCKTCRRYWTKGGTLRNIPVGGGCRKNKKPSSNSSSSSASVSTTSSSSGKKPSNVGVITTHHANDFANLVHSQQNYQNTPVGFGGFGGGMSSFGGGQEYGFLESKFSGLISQNPKPIDFLDSKFDLMGVNNHHDMGMVDHHHHNMGMNHGGGGGIMDMTCQRLMLSNYDQHHYNNNNNNHDDQRVTIMDVKPNPKMLSLDWQVQEQGCSNGGGGKVDGGGYSGGAGGYINGLGSSWNGFINGYGSSTKTNSLV